MRCTTFLSTLAVVLLSTHHALAVSQLIGDIDGFGFPSTIGLVRATSAPHTQPADVDGDGIIEAGEYLPDLNKDGLVAIASGDEFDNRSAAEAAGAHGEQWTDTAIVGRGVAHGATFTFSFVVPAVGDIDYGVDHFINFVFGDYDVFPATITVDGQTVGLTRQGGSQDGLVQVAWANVPWADMTDGTVVIRINAVNEPYLAFDYALLDTDQIADRDGDGVPDNIDNCPDDPNTDQSDSDSDGQGDVCDICADDDADGICDEIDNCLGIANPAQDDADDDGLGDACDACALDADNDADGDGICGDVDICSDTQIPEAGVPENSLGVNRFALVDGDGIFDTVSPRGRGPQRAYSIEDTRGCSCEQIIAALGLGEGHTKFGCSISAMDEWVAAHGQ